MLTGGGTGIGLLKRVGERSGEIDWSKVHLYWGDERFVPHDDDERNDKQAREALLDHIDIPAANVHAMAATDGEFGDDLDAAAQGYAELLAESFDTPGPSSTSTCWAWAARATSTRCSRTPRPCARPSGWWSG